MWCVVVFARARACVCVWRAGSCNASGEKKVCMMKTTWKKQTSSKKPDC